MIHRGSGWGTLMRSRHNIVILAALDLKQEKIDSCLKLWWLPSRVYQPCNCTLLEYAKIQL